MEDKISKIEDIIGDQMEKVKDIEVKGKAMHEKAEALTGIKDKIKRLEEKMIEGKLCDLKDKIETLEASLPTAVSTAVKDVPYVMVCSYQSDWGTPNSTIPYDSIVSENNNCDRPGGGCGQMDINTGVFTSGTAGYYSVTFSGVAIFDQGEYVWVFIYKSGKSVS